MDDLECNGTESSLFDCPFSENSKCGHGEDAGSTVVSLLVREGLIL